MICHTTVSGQAFRFHVPQHVLLLLLLLTPSCPTSSSSNINVYVPPWELKPQCHPLNRTAFTPPIDDRRGRQVLPYMRCPDINARRFGCHGQGNEDCKIYKRFFRHEKWRRSNGGGFFVEMGGYDGVSFSNSLIFEWCLGWNGLLVEGHPAFYQQLVTNRPCTINVWGAVCDSSSTEGNLMGHSFIVHDFIQSSINATEIAQHNFLNPNAPVRVRLVPCRTMGSILTEHNVTTIDFFSLDVEGSEADVLETIDFSRVKIKVMIVEIDFLGKRNSSVDLSYNQTRSEIKMRRIHDILTQRAGMLPMATEGALVPECTRQRLKLPKRVLDLKGNALYVSPEMRDDVC